MPQKSHSEPIVTFSPTPPVRSECNVDFADTGHDVWRTGALGKTKRLVYQLLDTKQGRTSRDIAQTRRYRSARSAQYHLSALEACGLACRGPDGLWRRLDRDLDEIAKELGVNGKGAEQRERHIRERRMTRPARTWWRGATMPSRAHLARFRLNPAVLKWSRHFADEQNQMSRLRIVSPTLASVAANQNAMPKRHQC